MAVRHLHAEPARVWRAVTDPEALSRWFTACARTSPGIYAFTFTDEAASRTKTAIVTGCVPDTSFTIDWRDPGYRTSTVTVTVRADAAAGTELTLQHDMVPSSLLDGYRTGWVDYLDDLANVLALSSPGPVAP